MITNNTKNPPISDRPVFVLGCPRSGTTLVGGMLADTKWGAAVETHFITKYASDSVDLRDEKQFHDFLARITGERYIQQWGVAWDASQLYRELREFSYAELVNLICLERAKMLGVTGWADKTPHYCLEFERIQLLHSLFPNAKFVFVVRDGRDVANSLLQKKWGPNNIYMCAEYWAKCNRSILEAQQQLEGQCVLITYERLLTAPMDELRKLFTFLNLDDVERRASGLALTTDPSRIGQWRSKLSRRQVKVFEHAAGDVLQTYGYPTTHPAQRLSWTQEFGYQLHDKLIWAAFMFDQNVIDAVKIRFFGKQPFGE